LFNRVNFISHGGDRRRKTPDVLDSHPVQTKCSVFAPGAVSFPQPAQTAGITGFTDRRTLVEKRCAAAGNEPMRVK
jgi:hypothetical protein